MCIRYRRQVAHLRAVIGSGPGCFIKVAELARITKAEVRRSDQMCIRDRYSILSGLVCHSLRRRGMPEETQAYYELDHVDERTHDTVSYTHLDVYKRQDGYTTLLESVFFGFSPCSLLALPDVSKLAR